MKIRIKEFRGRHAVTGFYPKASVRLRGGQVYEYNPGEEELFEQALATGCVEEVHDTPRRGRPPKEVA
jgi:hypothetical protein